jgi:nonsense-mediated mRNA decay protein 3
MADIPCPICGAPSKGVCPRCFLKKNPIRIVRQEYRECECGLTFFKGRWFRDKHEMVSDMAEKSILPPADVKVFMKDAEYSMEKGELVVKAQYRVYYKGVGFEESQTWSVRPEKFKCGSCKKQGSGYFEAVLQVRAEGIELGLEPREIASVEEVRGGIDVYLISDAYAQARVSTYISNGLQVIRSSKLHTKRAGKDIYRHFYSIKHPPFSPGDFIRVNDKIYRVIELGKTMKLEDIQIKKPRSFRMSALKDAEFVAKSADIRSATVSEIRPDGAQIIDSFNQKTYEIRNTPELRQSTQIQYLLLDGKIHIISTSAS